MYKDTLSQDTAYFKRVAKYKNIKGRSDIHPKYSVSKQPLFKLQQCLIARKAMRMNENN